MFKNLCLFILTATTVICTSNAVADAGLYVGANYGQVEYEESAGSLDFTAASAIIGYNLSSTFGIEARYAQGLGDDDIGGTSVDIDTMTSVLARLSLQNDANLTPYVLAGYTQGKLEAEGIGSETAEDFTYGFGLGFRITDKLSLTAEYV